MDDATYYSMLTHSILNGIEVFFFSGKLVGLKIIMNSPLFFLVGSLECFYRFFRNLITLILYLLLTRQHYDTHYVE